MRKIRVAKGKKNNHDHCITPCENKRVFVEGILEVKR